MFEGEKEIVMRLVLSGCPNQSSQQQHCRSHPVSLLVVAVVVVVLLSTSLMISRQTNIKEKSLEVLCPLISNSADVSTTGFHATQAEALADPSKTPQLSRQWRAGETSLPPPQLAIRTRLFFISNNFHLEYVRRRRRPSAFMQRGQFRLNF